MTASTEVAWENSRHLATPPLVSPPNDVWETSAEIPYGWHVTTQIWVLALLIGRAAWEIWFNQSEALPRFGYWRVIRMEFAPKPSLKGTGPWKVRSGLWAPERYLDIKSSVLHGPVALFFFARLNRSLHFWVFKCQISACTFWNHEVLVCRFLLYEKHIRELWDEELFERRSSQL